MAKANSKPKADSDEAPAAPRVVPLTATKTIRHGARRVVAGTTVQSDDPIVAMFPNYFEER